MSDMGEVRSQVRLENYRDRVLFEAGHMAEKDIRVQEIEMIVDTGAVMNLIPRDLAETLGLKTVDSVTVRLADEQKITMPRAGTLTLTVAGRTMHTDCLVGPPGCEALLGQIVLEGLDLIVDPLQRCVIPRPEFPFGLTLKLKSAPLQPVSL